MIRANTARSPVSAQCGILGVPRSTCYWMTGHPGTEHVDPTAGDVRAVRRDSRGRHGDRKIKAVLERMGVIASGRRISNIMRERGMTGAYARRRSKCVLSSAGAVLPWTAVRVTGQLFTGLPSAGFVWFWLFCYCMRAWVRL